MMDDLDREIYCHTRLPKVVNDGPTARYMAYLADLDAKVHTLPTAVSTTVPTRREGMAS